MKCAHTIDSCASRSRFRSDEQVVGYHRPHCPRQRPGRAHRGLENSPRGVPFSAHAGSGHFEPQDPLPSNVECILRRTQRIHLAGQIEDPSTLYTTMDIVVLPSYREGLGLVALEAASMALPVVATKIPGCVDAVMDGQTGTLVPPRDAWALAQAIHRYLEDPSLRRRHGLAGRERILRDFRQEVMWEALYQEYVRPCARKASHPGGFPSRPRVRPYPRLGSRDLDNGDSSKRQD